MVTNKLSGDEADTADIRIAILFTEAESFREMSAHHVAVKQCYLSPMFEQPDREDVCSRGFTGAAQACKPQAKSHPVSRRVRLREDVSHFRTREPGRQLATAPQVLLPHFRS